jgi:hypothetical protein
MLIKEQLKLDYNNFGVSLELQAYNQMLDRSASRYKLAAGSNIPICHFARGCYYVQSSKASGAAQTLVCAMPMLVTLNS